MQIQRLTNKYKVQYTIFLSIGFTQGRPDSLSTLGDLLAAEVAFSFLDYKVKIDSRSIGKDGI